MRKHELFEQRDMVFERSDGAEPYRYRVEHTATATRVSPSDGKNELGRHYALREVSNRHWIIKLAGHTVATVGGIRRDRDKAAEPMSPEQVVSFLLQADAEAGLL